MMKNLLCIIAITLVPCLVNAEEIKPDISQVDISAFNKLEDIPYEYAKQPLQRSSGGQDIR